MEKLNGRYKNFLGKKLEKVKKEWAKETNPKRNNWLHIIILANKGLTFKNIALITDYSKRHIARVISRYKKCERLRDFKPDYKVNVKKKTGKKTIKKAKEVLKNSPKKVNYNLVSWNPKLLKRYFEKQNIYFSYSTSRRLMRKLNYRVKRGRYVPQEKPSEKRVRVYKKLVERALKQDYIVFFLDESFFRILSIPFVIWALKGSKVEVPFPNKKMKIGKSVIGAVGSNGNIFARSFEKITKKEVLLFIKYLIKKAGKKIAIVMDNASIHKNNYIKDYLINNKIRVIWTPTYSPELNPKEFIWRFVKQNVTNGDYYEDEKELIKAVHNGIDYLRKNEQDWLIEITLGRFLLR